MSQMKPVRRFYIFLLPLLAFHAYAIELPNTVEDLCVSHGDTVRKLLDALDLEKPELRAVRSSIETDDIPGACHALLHYYEVRFPAVTPDTNGTFDTAAVDAMLEDRFVFYGVEDGVPRVSGGGLDWSWRGPTNDREWAWALNRHFYLSSFLDAWLSSGNTAYIRKIDELIKDWVISNPYTGKKDSSAAWRGLEVALRMKGWQRVFSTLQNEPAFSPAARLLMLTSLPDHAHYLRNFHAAGNNWLTMEMNGLATIATTWPELRDSGTWLEYAFEQLVPALEEQVNPDGAQTELTSHYHRVALFNFQEFADTVEQAGHKVPDTYRAGLERMWAYLAYTMRPNGYGLQNNDSDYDFTRNVVLEAAERYHRPDWSYIASNGNNGTPPLHTPSVAFPCSGQVIFRDKYAGDADWMYFDIGPLGTGHVHYDKLHLSVTIGGRNILVDSGRYSYVGGPWREYFTGSASHNVLLIDGQNQKSQPARYDVPLNGLVINEDGTEVSCFPESLGDQEKARKAPDFIIAPEYVFARGSFEQGYRGIQGNVVHTRIVLRHNSVEGIFVIDHVETDQPREITALWHFHPDCDVVIEGGEIKTTNDDGLNLSLFPLGDTTWNLSLVKGQESPSIQGWYSPTYNVKLPAWTAVCTAHINGNATFAWRLLPGKEPTKEPCSLLLEESGWASIIVDGNTVPLIRTPCASTGFPDVL